MHDFIIVLMSRAVSRMAIVAAGFPTCQVDGWCSASFHIDIRTASGQKYLALFALKHRIS